jgi:hypothetical protein
MPLDLTGIRNVGEFYSHHYLDALLGQDLKGLFARWRGVDSDATPDRRLNRSATDFFRAKTNALRQRQPELCYPPSHAIHVALLEALGYPYDFSVRYLADGSAVPVLGAVKRDGRPYLWLVEATFTDLDDAPLDQLPFRAQYPPSADGAGPGVRLATMHRVKGLEFAHVLMVGVNEGVIPSPHVSEDRVIQERCLLHVAASRARDTLTITSWGRASRFIA